MSLTYLVQALKRAKRTVVMKLALCHLRSKSGLELNNMEHYMRTNRTAYQDCAMRYWVAIMKPLYKQIPTCR